jgi:hypothetical protein
VTTEGELGTDAFSLQPDLFLALAGLRPKLAVSLSLQDRQAVSSRVDANGLSVPRDGRGRRPYARLGPRLFPNRDGSVPIKM